MSHERFEWLSPDEIEAVFSLFRHDNPHPKSELIAPNPYTLLVSVVLSAQATDKSVNRATAALYAVADTPEKMVALGEARLTEAIRSIGLYRTKAKHIIALSRLLIERFNSRLPDSRDELMSLPGVGRKTANVVLNVVFHQPTMPVDTHLLRLAPRIGLSDAATPEGVEADLLKRIPPAYLPHAHHWLILHGRYQCTARNPHCGSCLIAHLCKHNF